jgi:hypothetical protein
MEPREFFSLNYDGATASNFQDVTSQLFAIPTTSGNISLTNLSSLGEDAAGELYMPATLAALFQQR